MNKYSQKIIKFINTNLSSYLNNSENYSDQNIIRKIQNIYDENVNNNQILTLESEIKINKLHNQNEPVFLFIIFKDLCNDKLIEIKNSVFDNVSNFNCWYRVNGIKFDLYDILKQHKNKIKYKTYFDLLFSVSNDRKILHELLYKNLFISLDNIHYIESHDIIYKQYNSNNIKLDLFLPIDEHENYDEPDIEKISLIYSIMSNLFNKKNEHLRLIVLYGNQKKQINYDECDKTLCSNNINSGLSIKHDLIMIWRKEEFYKVLIHELIHFFGIDFYVNDEIYKLLEHSVNKKYKNIKNDKINESYTEAIAILINSVVYSKIHNIDVNKIIKYEIIFSHFQIAKILNYFDNDSIGNLDNIILKQNTSVFSYYIIKTMLLTNYKKMYNFWETNGFQILNTNEDEYEIIYNEILNNNNLDVDIVDFCILYFKKLNKIEKNEFINKTMRMSVFEL